MFVFPMSMVSSILTLFPLVVHHRNFRGWFGGASPLQASPILHLLGKPGPQLAQLARRAERHHQLDARLGTAEVVGGEHAEPLEVMERADIAILVVERAGPTARRDHDDGALGDRLAERRKPPGRHA